MRTNSEGPVRHQPMSEPSRTPVIGSLSRRILGLGSFMCPKTELAREKNVSGHADQTPDLFNTTLTEVVYKIVMGLFSISIPFLCGKWVHIRSQKLVRRSTNVQS